MNLLLVAIPPQKGEMSMRLCILFRAIVPMGEPDGCPLCLNYFVVVVLNFGAKVDERTWGINRQKEGFL